MSMNRRDMLAGPGGFAAAGTLNRLEQPWPAPMPLSERVTLGDFPRKSTSTAKQDTHISGAYTQR